MVGVTDIVEVGEASGVGEAGSGLGEGEGDRGVLDIVGSGTPESVSLYWFCGRGVGVVKLVRDIVKQDAVVVIRRQIKKIRTRFNIDA